MLLFFNTKLLFVFSRLSPKCAKSLLGFPRKRFLEQDIRDGFSGNRPGENCPYGRNFCPYARKPLKHKEGGPMGPSLFYATSNLCFSWDDEKDKRVRRLCAYSALAVLVFVFSQSGVCRLMAIDAAALSR